MRRADRGALGGDRRTNKTLRTPSANRASKLKPYLAMIMKPMKLTPASSITALMICTQVVAVMPPNST